MPTIVATSGSASANSFVTAAEATTYLEARLNSSAWTDGESDDELKALIEATREISLLSFVGTRTDGTQVLSWPREYAVDPDYPNVAGLTDTDEIYFDDDEIPVRVKNATIELALEFLKAGTSDIAALDSTAAIKSESVGPVSVTYMESYQRAQGLQRFPRVMNWIAPLLDASSSGGLEIVRT